jgi:hypothetical protein
MQTSDGAKRRGKDWRGWNRLGDYLTVVPVVALTCAKHS